MIESTAPPAPTVAPAPRAKTPGVLVYLAILATLFVVASLALGFMSYQSLQSLKKNDQRIEQLQVDTNDNLCNQQAYIGGTQCSGGDANGGSGL